MKVLLIILIGLIACIGVTNIESTVQAEGEIPEPYYTPAPQQYGIDVLREYFQGKYWKRAYEVDVFDCTEMSALLECALENEGFHTYIIVGKYEDGWHAWVKVETAFWRYAIVESTTLTVIGLSDAEYNKYWGIYQYETIYDALEVNQSAFDWWN